LSCFAQTLKFTYLLS